MKLLLTALLLTALVVSVGCSSGTPKAATPTTRVDLGRVPVSTDMNKVKLAQFTIENKGNGPLKLSNVKVKLVEGC